MRRENQVYPMARVVPRPSVSPGWYGRWASFLESHGDWWELQSSSGEAVYCLPGPVIDELCDSHSARTPRGHRHERILTAGQERSERDFTDLCAWWCQWHQDVVGVSDCGVPIPYPFLNEQLVHWRAGRPPAGNHWIDMFGELHQTRLAICQSQMVHAAWLIQQPKYWHDLTEIRKRWRRIRHLVTFSEASGRLVPLAALAIHARRGDIPDQTVARFHEDVWAFARRWHLAGWITWHLPLPQLPLLDLPAEIVYHCRCRDEPRSAIPSFYPPQRLFGEWKTVWQSPIPDPRQLNQGQCSRRVAEACLHNELPTYALVLRLFLAELAARTRFGGMLPRGVTGRLMAGLADEVGRDVEHVKRIRRRVQVAF